MESSREKSIVDFFKAKTILVTGSTGFLAKMFVEKLLRVQADVERVFLLIRAADAASAMQRLEDEVRTGLIPEKRLSMGETLRSGSNSCYLDIEAEIDLVEKKKVELQADHNLTPIAQKLAMKELGMQRFFGWPNTYVFTKAMGEMVLGHSRGNLPLVIVRPSIITSILRDPLPGWIEGIRTTDIFMMAYADRKLQSFPGDPQMTVDLIPGDMVVNAMMATTVAHSKQQSEFIYHVGSSTRNPITYDSLLQCWFDDANLEKLRAMMGKEEMFEMDSKHIEWNSYLHGIHIPGILKYECK
ncbi:hypothetical protein ZIOFF_008893 [Zingiber officinale]|uniref:Fatty acyl-CoA reductase n=1 Tax=Zingiber officinale TaxID=94328 RepID=A0A8J5IIU0_ZINOF|nr:hypothetical protein ZIOFF_008893 [Zingiber officinale]